MAPKKFSKSVKALKVVDYSELILKDVLCPICRSILIEPVTLPCNHGFCSSCFNSTMENANLVCPLCRIRIGSWLRKAKKEDILINYNLWDSIKIKFPQQVKNKLNGVDDNLEDECDIIVSYPGEIRKEYESQKQKAEEEFIKKCEADLKASEDLIRKICEEDDYERAIMKEKLEIDEQVAKKLAEELALTSPSTSKVKQTKRLGPMDKFVKQENDKNYHSIPKKQLNNFASKEYTCRVLCMDKKNPENQSLTNLCCPIISKKVKQIQRIADTDVASDSSDCIESELRYFQPIDYRGNPPSERKPAIRVPTRKPNKNATTRILSPTGLIKFHSNFLESAFARISFSKSKIKNESSVIPVDEGSPVVTNNLKRSNCEGEVDSPKRKIKRKSSVEDIEEESPTLPIFSKKSNMKSKKSSKANIIAENCSSPPFFGFERYLEHKDSDMKAITNNKNNGSISDDNSNKLLQEKADLEFAKKLQEEFNRNSHFTRSTRRTMGSSKRQTTLDEIIKTSYRVK